ncbi:unnamed protein product [Paramecium sonneborni]|uniref:Transmembrane protein n=1 Tax=Paramecium sonneborni TaxID=65129 RepID=A0A8S1RA05_9CILI|nr:unnamed protein product [Paramecium sonneborni]
MNINQLPQGEQNATDFLNRIPIGNKIITIITIFVFLINSLFDQIFTYYFLNIPELVFHGFQLQRLFFTQFIEGFFGLILMPIFFIMNFSDLEKTLGSVVFLIDFFIKGFLVQIIFLILSLIIQNDSMPSYGLMNLFIVYLSLQCFANPEQLRTFCFFPCLVPSKYIPFIFVLFGFFMKHSIDPVAAIILALIEAKYFNFMIFRPTQQFIQTIENSIIFSSLKQRSDFHLINQDFQIGSSNQQEKPATKTQEFQGQGNQIGTSINFDNIVISDTEQFQQDYQK